MNQRKIIVSVIGSSSITESQYEEALLLGQELGKLNLVVVTGGLGGVMEAVSRGAKERGGTTVGILPSRDRESANKWIDIPIPTNLGEMRNFIVVNSGDLVISMFGGYGTLTEIGFALKLNKKIIAYRSWKEMSRVSEKFLYFEDFQEFLKNVRAEIDNLFH